MFGLRIARFKLLLFVVGLLPLARWVWLGATGGLTANPVEFLTRSSGTWTLVALWVTLSISPLRAWLRQPALLRVRRMCGLFAFFYACLHLTTYIWWDQWFDVASIARDVVRRPFITVGFAGFLGLLALAITSTRGWMRRLGPRWQALHRLVYLVGVLVLLHYWWQKAGKNDFSAVFIYTVIFAGLMGWRLLRRPGPGRRGAGPARP
ncbi:MAG: protein-methionine-sulfoxide reductase heme-binding subunit MsrQ [Pigmentiphaga sp.]|uniref:sulfite oxidase heme-binding subunit YedZ n=1 Tax=Pigmentiphaga sp. TaxID=1977564 RepID=UPI0029AA8020|nr:protein-methionine-sulfoxide reductase heme-binding subunit MsrQ [Pigmentiphaga sp.]MDX3906937.1 protein-methionine-sulfoxide reductase heme-binding subunit MsrQ [Pigmentiphaga sp.]